MNNLVFGLIAVLALFAFFKLARVKASSKQLNRDNHINRFGNFSNKNENIIDGESEEVIEENKKDD